MPKVTKRDKDAMIQRLLKLQVEELSREELIMVMKYRDSQQFSSKVRTAFSSATMDHCSRSDGLGLNLKFVTDEYEDVATLHVVIFAEPVGLLKIL